MASMRRTPAATPLSATMTKRPMSPVARTCVPPHSSTLKPGIDTTRTRSPYFSPNSAIAPAAIASCVFFTSVCTGVFRRICSLTMRSISSDCSRVTALKCTKSKRSRSGATSEPACLTCGPSTCRSAACSRCVAVWLRRVASRDRRRPQPSRDRAVPASPLCDVRRRAAAASPARTTPVTLRLAAEARQIVPDVRHLSAGLEVERRLAPGRRKPSLAGRQRRHLLPVAVEQREDLRVRASSCRSRGTPVVAGRLERRLAVPSLTVQTASRTSPPLNALLARAFSRCASMARSKPSWSNVSLRSCDHVLDEVARQSVGVVQPERRRHRARRHRLTPRGRESLRAAGDRPSARRRSAPLRSASPVSTMSRPVLSSGYASPNSRTTVSTNVERNGSSRPSRLPCRIARRMILRRT